jgi:glycosyltransferase involved in cell wall biosynthesis
MISICIPIYNFDVRKLVYDLLEQADEQVEILLIDDDSQVEFKEKNRELTTKGVTYIELESNVGRAKIRNLFLNHAKNKYLLFLDCDSQIINANYIRNYKNAITESTLLICGGSIYSPECPSNEQRLRWVYGTTRESKTAKQRSLHPNSSFMTNNVLIEKQVLTSSPFDERITQYGHEDTLLGIEMEKRGITILHLQNPVMNIDIDKNPVFMKKTEDSLDSLVQIIHFYDEPERLKEHIKLLKASDKISRFQLKWVFNCIYKLFGASIRNRLITAKNPSMRLFMIYKLVYFIDHSK